jgi:hypothetical protein
MDAVIQKMITSELTINGIQGSHDAISIPWINFYNIFLSNNKLLDSTRSKQLGRLQETTEANTNRNNTRGNNNSSGTNSANLNSNTTTTEVKWTVKTMVMKKAMSFSNEDRAKCTPEQKKKNLELHKVKAKVSSTTVAANTNTVRPATPAPMAPLPPDPTPHTVMMHATDVRQLLSNNTSGESSPLHLTWSLIAAHIHFRIVTALIPSINLP